MRSAARSTTPFLHALLGVLLLCAGASEAAPSSKTKGKPKAAKPTASSMVDGEGGMPSPIKPVKQVPPEEMASRFFKEALAPYGEWIELGEYGQCWKPNAVDERWAPYTVGSWAYSRYGWTWVSAEEFGGIVFHYGRWVRAVQEGWCWVPDLEWSAAWVAWRYGSEAIGWAPLPPKAEWNPATGFGAWADHAYEIGPDNYVFCDIKDFDEKYLKEVIYNPSENPGCFLHTVNVTNISVLGKSIFTGGPAYNWVASRVKGKVPVVRVLKERSLFKFRESLNDAVDSPASFRSLVKRDTLTLVAPEWGLLTDPRKADALGFRGELDESAQKVKWVEGQTAEPQEKPEAAPQVVPAVAVLEGWEPVVGAQRSLLRAKVAREVAGMSPETHPAERFDAERDTPLLP